VNGNGILSVGNNKNFEYDISKDVFTADAYPNTPVTKFVPSDPLLSSYDAWGDLNVGGTGDDGQDLYEALQEFNAGTLIVDPHGTMVADYDTGTDTVVDSQSNLTPDAFWDYVL